MGRPRLLRLVLWGGSSGEGIILAPNAPVVDAAHRAGVRVLGNVFLPPTAYGGDLRWTRELVQRDAFGRFPIADKLIEVARAYGFDGWFLNGETGGGDRQLAAALKEFVRALCAGAPQLRITWYDAFNSDGQVGWQGALNDKNAAFFKASHTMFVDFRWSAAGLDAGHGGGHGHGPRRSTADTGRDRAYRRRVDHLIGPVAARRRARAGFAADRHRNGHRRGLTAGRPVRAGRIRAHPRQPHRGTCRGRPRPRARCGGAATAPAGGRGRAPLRGAQVLPGGGRRFLGGTAGIAYYVASLRRTSSEAATSLEVRATGQLLTSSRPAPVTHTW
ncbi:hypothetical protein [Streptomyces sp. H27-C3]|uniref:endo-beta-N-acetylglucosaminidase n=1 Tax=Streptomyces sp. H27-C3 TaxID=3046305 RepID=UPI0024BBD037|nr:hypothetical protein [Streptomyces sp. H27-C3]MDJ0464184.1 hypothetical protein [Streptomyces sp. H27-C3]